MPRIARLVVPHYPHHVTQRGNCRQPVFFSDHDYQAYTRTGKPRGDDQFLSLIKKITGIDVRPKRAGRKETK